MRISYKNLKYNFTFLFKNWTLSGNRIYLYRKDDILIVGHLKRWHPIYFFKKELLVIEIIK